MLDTSNGPTLTRAEDAQVNQKAGWTVSSPDVRTQTSPSQSVLTGKKAHFYLNKNIVKMFNWFRGITG